MENQQQLFNAFFQCISMHFYTISQNTENQQQLFWLSSRKSFPRCQLHFFFQMGGVETAHNLAKLFLPI